MLADRQYLSIINAGRRTTLGKVTFIEHDQTEHVAEFKAGSSVMQIAVDSAIPGIDGDCGGGVRLRYLPRYRHERMVQQDRHAWQ